jgi:Domain of unknown function (DUF1844)
MSADEGERTQNEEELFEKIEAELRRIGVGDYLAQLLITLSSMAFQRLGLTPETAADRDLEQARLAVDAFAAVLEVWAPTRPADEAAMFRSTLHQMRMAFVAAAAGSTAAESVSPGDDTPEEA